MLAQSFFKPETVKGIIIDTNLLLLFLIGLFDKNQIEKVRRIRTYSIDDFEKIIKLIDFYNKEVTVTSNILTEICNLSDGFNIESKYEFFKFLEGFQSKLTEHQEPSYSIIQNNQTAFYKFGISDASIVNLAKEKYLVITDDLSLYHFISSKSFAALNYNHLRQL